MPRAIVVRQHGGPEVYKVENIPAPPPPGKDQVLIRHTALGVNYTDIYYRSGLYSPPRMPYIPGVEGVGVVEAVGPGAEGIEVGQRVAYATVQSGAYSERRVLHKHFLVPVPDAISDEVAAAVLLKGMTAHYLLHRTYRVSASDVILVHAAAGGTGQLICQWARQIGATVLGTVSTPEKAEIAKRNGCTYPILYTQEDVVAAVQRITQGAGVGIVYDSIGADMLMKSLACLRPYGLLVSFGQSAGPVPPVNVLSFARKGVFLTRPTLAMYKAHRMELALSATEVFERVRKGLLHVNIENRYPLESVAKAHEALASRQTVGQSVVLL